eukprot:scaffold128803_cov23-Prasinocladus_malaysianus.AAC.1
MHPCSYGGRGTTGYEYEFPIIGVKWLPVLVLRTTTAAYRQWQKQTWSAILQHHGRLFDATICLGGASYSDVADDDKSGNVSDAPTRGRICAGLADAGKHGAASARTQAAFAC